MKENFDYKSLYLEKYKQLPHYLYLIDLLSKGIATSIISIVLFIMAFTSGDIEEFMLAAAAILVVGWVFAFVTAMITRWISSILISQSVVVADCIMNLTSNSDITPESQEISNIENELPEI